jgi:hypothetical protein
MHRVIPEYTNFAIHSSVFFLSAWVPANLPTMQHEINDKISLEMGRRVAARLREDPALLQTARDNLARWLRQNADAPALVRCYREWLTMLERPLGEICEILCADTEEGRRLRQNSPFAGVLPPSEVWSIKAAIRQRHAKTAA